MEEEAVISLNISKRKWPTTILVINRTARVPGRMMLLIISIITIKGVKIIGISEGTKCANICWVLLIHPYSMKDIQRGRANVKVNTR